MTNEELRVWAIEVAVEAGVRGSSALVDAADEIVAFVRSKREMGCTNSGDEADGIIADLPRVSQWAVRDDQLVVGRVAGAAFIPLDELKDAMAEEVAEAERRKARLSAWYAAEGVMSLEPVEPDTGEVA